MITDRDSDSTETQENVVGREEKHYGKVENSQSLDIVQKSIIFFKTVINDLIKSPLKLFVLFLSAFLFFSAVYSRYLSLQSDTYLFYELIGVSRTNAIILSVLLSVLLFFSRHNKFFIVIFNYIFWYMLFYKIYSISLFRNEQYLSLIYILSIIFTYISVALIFHGLRYLFFIFYFLFLPIVLFVANYLSIYGSFGMEAIEALYQTNYNEAKDYFINMLNYNISSFIIILYGFLICNLLFKPSKNHIKIKINGNINAFNFGIFTIGLFFLFSSTNVSFFKDFLVNFKNYKIDKTLSAEMLQKANSYKFNYNLKTNKNIDIIVVIGESLTKHNMSLYGYEKNTTPNMDKSDLIKFNDVISPHSHTEQSLSQVLTLADISKGRYFSEFDSYSIIRMLKEAGYHTAWLSNQNEHGVWENKVASIGKQANKYLFLKSNYKFVNKTFDHELLPHISSVFNNNNKNNAIFVHLYANHGSYGDRYPSDFPMVEEWDSGKLGVTDHTRSVIRNYDTSVKYVDMIIDKIFKIADNREKPTIVIFVPDHGENTFDRTAHGSDNHNYVHVEIPFIFYANEKYKQIYYNKIREIKNNINKPYSSVDLPYSIMDILGVSGIPKIKEKSIFSKYLNIVERTTLSGRVNYDKKDRGVGAKGRAIYNLKQISERMGKKYANKVLPHRMNTIMPTKMARDVFSGVEIDVVYDSEKDMFDLYHPPLKSNNFSLEEYLTYIPNNLRLWLDWKNATPDNIKPAIKKLNKLNLKNRVIIETSEKFNGVDLISQSGYEQSYYLPTSEIEKCSNNDNKDCKILSHRIIDNIENNHFNAISFDVGGWNFYQKYLKDYIYNNNLNVHLWDSVTEISSKNFRNTMIYKYIVDDNVKTLLLQYKTGYKK